MGSMGTNMTGMTQMGGTMMGGGMKPWLHFTMGDNILFMSWVPLTPGAVFGACVGLFMLAIIQRWLAAMRAIMEVYWSQKTEELIAARFPKSRNESPECQDKKDSRVFEAESLPAECPSVQRPSTLSRLRRAAPFIPTHDLARGAMHAFQAALTYALMLAIMTFHAGYFIAIVLGLGVGEILFGRFCASMHHH